MSEMEPGCRALASNMVPAVLVIHWKIKSGQVQGHNIRCSHKSIIPEIQ